MWENTFLLTFQETGFIILGILGLHLRISMQFHQ